MTNGDTPLLGLYYAERNLDTVDYDVLEEEDGSVSDEVGSHPVSGHPRSQREDLLEVQDESVAGDTVNSQYSHPASELRTQMGSTMSNGMKTGGTAVDKFGGGLASWGTSVSNVGHGWTSMGESLQTVDEKIG